MSLVSTRNTSWRPYRIRFDNGYANIRFTSASVDMQLYEIATEALRKALLADAYTCAQAMAHGADFWREVPEYTEFQRIARFVTDKAHHGMDYTVQGGFIGRDGDAAAAWIELRGACLRGWRGFISELATLLDESPVLHSVASFLRTYVARPTITVRGGLCARINEDGWGAVR